MPKFYNIDPQTASQEELVTAIKECRNKEEYYHTMEQACKVFINSQYGALANSFYNCSNVNIAESITLQGQDLIKYSVEVVNKYFNELWTDDAEAHKNISEYMLERFPEFNTAAFMQNTQNKVMFGKTLQIYGDSFTGDSIIHTDTGDYTVKELFDESFNALDIDTDIDTDEKIRVESTRLVRNLNLSDNTEQYSPVAYIMRHKNSKQLYKITLCDDETKSIICTEDHSVIAYNTFSKQYEVVSPKTLSAESYYMICFSNNGAVSFGNYIIEKCSEYHKYVYDIAIDTNDPDLHNVYANDILVHNTDSVDGNSIIRTASHPEGITIAELYNENSNNSGESTLAGHESVHTDDSVANYNAKTKAAEYQSVKRIIRHKVNKPKWRLKTTDGKEVICTGDHSLVVVRDDTQLVIKPKDIIKGDKVIEMVSLEIECIEIESCEQIGYFEDEYVYDIEMSDESHTFFCNDILVHNSAYITLQPLIESCHIPIEMETTFVIAVNKFVLEKYLEKMFDIYAKNFNCKENLEKFELEKVARSVIMLAKKKYIMDISWKEGGKDGVFLNPLHSVIIVGIEVIQGSTPGFCRKAMKEFINFVLGMLATEEKISYDMIINKLKEIKAQFAMQSPDEICKSFVMSNYEKYIKDDKHSLELFTGVSCPIHVRGAATYNYMLFNNAKKYKTKYNFIKKGDKVKFYYIENSKGADVFSFLPNEFPIEFAPKMDYDMQFEKLILEPLNRIIQAIGFHPVPVTLTYSVGLWLSLIHI